MVGGELVDALAAVSCVSCECFTWFVVGVSVSGADCFFLLLTACTLDCLSAFLAAWLLDQLPLDRLSA